MEMLADRRALGLWVAEVRRRGERLGFVPTMGALHEGHLSLVRAARAQTDRVVVSIFVNPTQFAPNEDFNRYPRTLEQDQALLARAGCSAIFHPPVSELYGQGCQTKVQLEPLGHDLCGRFRPSHFQGVATVVAILFNLIRPDQAFFGWKDYQQVILIQRMVRDLAMPVEVIGLPIVREADGLAMSSRNRYLTPDARQRAVGLYQALQAARNLRQLGHGVEFCDERGRATSEQDNPLVLCARRVLASFGIQDIDYVDVRAAETLDPVPIQKMWAGFPDPVMLIAARLGTTRLIDNMILSLDAVA